MANVTAMLQKPLCGNQMNLATLKDDNLIVYPNKNIQPVADLSGVQGTWDPLFPLGQNFFSFMQFSGKIGQIIG